MTALVQRDLQHRSRVDRRWRDLSQFHDARLGFDVDEAVTQDSSWVEPSHAPKKTALQSMSYRSFLEMSYWSFLDLNRDHLQAEKAQNYGELRSYSLSVSESFQIAADEYQTITIDPDIMSGAPCITGTRIPVYMILDAIRFYGSAEGALESYPNLTLDQVNDAIGFAKIVVECPLADDEP